MTLLVYFDKGKIVLSIVILSDHTTKREVNVQGLGTIYRVSHQCGNTFNFNFLILYQCYWKSKTCFEKFRSKPSRGHLDFDFFQKNRLFFRVDKTRNKTEIFFGSMPSPPPFFQNVPRFCFLRFMYPGT